MEKGRRPYPVVVESSRFQAVFCANDLLAFGAPDALRVQQVTAEQSSSIGYDDLDMASTHDIQPGPC